MGAPLYYDPSHFHTENRPAEKHAIRERNSPAKVRVLRLNQLSGRVRIFPRW